MTNADDIILGTGDLDYLRQTFGNRPRFFRTVPLRQH